MLAACDTRGGGPNGDRVGPAAPFGLRRPVAPVDPLIVAHRLMDAEEYELALKKYNEAAAIHGINAEVLSGIGSANLRLGRLVQAEVFLRRAVDKEMNSPSAWNNLGVVLISLQQIYEARNAFKIAFGLVNGDSELIRNNLILAERLIADSAMEVPEETDFMLVRQGNGVYLLLGN
ncbi:MAG TPA: tetratricopeptide repeat protein [Paracoccaceae bacterium]|nr:tetratricopeptide repeat protein [Paracoccaceae bacterium]